MALLVGEIPRRNAAAVPGRGAASMGERRVTYGELDVGSNRLAHALRGLGVRHGDQVISWTDTTLDPLYEEKWDGLWQAILDAGWVAAMHVGDENAERLYHI